VKSDLPENHKAATGGEQPPDITAQLESLTAKCAQLEEENRLLRLSTGGIPESTPADADLQRPWQTHGHGHYEYIETICSAYTAGVIDGSSGKSLTYPNGRDYPDQNAAYEIGHIDGKRKLTSGEEQPQQPASSAGLTPSDREIVTSVVAYLNKQRSNSDAPGHSHRTPGVWDESNRPEIAGKPCEWCALWKRFAALATPSAGTG
jgi:hypothetical protein